MDANCNSKLKQFFKNTMFIEVDIVSHRSKECCKQTAPHKILCK